MPEIPLDEKLARFILNRRYIRNSDNTVKYGAFSPNDNSETSVFCISDISEEEIWDIGNNEVSAPQGKPLLGRADIIASMAIENKLSVIHSGSHPRHADIVGWPEEKEKRKMIATYLANESQLSRK